MGGRPAGILREVLRPAEIFAMLAPATNLLFGPVILIAIATRLSPTVQGYYFTFGSLLSFQVFFELGLTQVIVQFASHEWADLRSRGQGEFIASQAARSRLASLFRFAVRWYIVAAALTWISLSAAGLFFFSQAHGSGVDWIEPWVTLCFVTGLNISLLPLWALLEGCNQIDQVYRFRLISIVIQNATIISALFLGWRLWTTVAAGAVTTGVSAGTLFFGYRRLLVNIWRGGNRVQIAWREELLPMQWRIGLSWLSGYFIYSLFTPILFHYRGPIVAGQMGMTWALASSLTNISSGWITPKAARFGALIARRRYDELDRLAAKSGLASVAMVSLGAAIAWAALWAGGHLGFSVVQRFLPLLPTAIFLLAQILMQISHVQALYLRAHKQDPFAWLSFWSAVLIALSSLFFVRSYGEMGVGGAYFATTAVVILPGGSIIYWRCRRRWHADAGQMGSF